MTTLVVQSHRDPLPAPWYQTSTASVLQWCRIRSYEYRWYGDEIFARLPGSLAAKLANEPVVASDLARLVLLQELLADDYERVVWVDADVLVLEPAALTLPDADALFGREVWVQPADPDAPGGRVRTYRKIHNAFMAFRAAEPVLPFYRMSAERILNRYDFAAGPVVPQLVGPKLITLLHNAIGFDVLEAAGMLSPWVGRDLLAGGGPALERFQAESAVLPAAVNVCGSAVRDGLLSDAQMSLLIDRLLAVGFGG